MTAVATPPSTPSPSVAKLPHVATTPTKTVLFKWVGGQWKVEVTLGENDPPFTPRDFNQLARTLTVKVQEIRRLAYLEYLKNQKLRASRVSPLTVAK